MRTLLTVVCLLIAAPVLAQTNPVPANQPFTVAFDHSGQNVTGFQCVLDGKPSGAVLAATARTCVIPGQAAGPNTVAVEAINAFGKATSPAFTATAGTPPEAPGNLRIQVTTTATIEVTPSGQPRLLAQTIEATKVE